MIIDRLFRHEHAPAIIVEGATRDMRQLARDMLKHGRLARDSGRSGSAVPYFEEAIRLLRLSDDITGLASALRQLGDIHQSREDFDIAEPLYGEALAIYRALDDIYAVEKNSTNIPTGCQSPSI